MNFADIDAIYENSKKVFEDGLWLEMVDFPELAEFHSACCTLGDLVKRHALEGPWIELLDMLKLIHAWLGRSPCRPSWLLKQEKPTMFAELLNGRLHMRLQSVDNTVRSSFERVGTALQLLSKLDTNPLAVRTAKLISSFGEKRSIIVLRNGRFWEECRAQLLQQDPLLQFQICKPTELRNHPVVEELVLYGSPCLLKFRNESFLVGSPVAPAIWFVLCAHEHVGAVVQSFLKEESEYRMIGMDRPPREPETHFEKEPEFVVQPRAFVLKHREDSDLSRVANPENSVKAIPLVLGGRKGIYVPEEGGLYTANTIANNGKRSCSSVERLDACELEAGMLVLLTTKGGGDMIPGVADWLLQEEAKSVRELESLWKHKLEDKVERLGIARVAEVLGTSPQNVRNWCNPRNIAPEKLEDHLRPILRLVGLESYFPAILDAIAKLRWAHQTAGMRLQTDLLKTLRGLDLREAYMNGLQEIREQAEGPAKTVYLVEDVKDNAGVSARLIGRVLDLEDAAE